MEKEGKNQRVAACNILRETDFVLQWGNRKRLRCQKMKDEDVPEKPEGLIRKRITFHVDRGIVRTDKETPSPLPHNFFNKNFDGATMVRSSESENLKSQSSSPEKEERYYTTRGSMGLDESGKISMEAGGVEDKGGIVWPKLLISLSSKEKEEDFMAMKGCKPPQRPKKRAKFIQRSLLLVSPGTWLSDICQERYEVREKKTSRKRRRGLKAMGSMESDSE